jgi:hypothetical protein
MLMPSLDERIEEEVAALGDLPRSELAARWSKAYGCPPPKGVKHGLLERAAAWHLQARHLGGLSPMARKAIRDAARQRNCRAATPVKLRDDGSALVTDQGESPQRRTLKPAGGPRMRAGMRLVREWNGRTHIVDITSDGFMFDGKTYRSLSAIAKRITGAHWSGPRFFGV